MKLAGTVLGFCLLCMSAGAARADVFHFTPNPADLNDLDHDYWYIWGIGRPWSSSDLVVSATLSFDSIRNWDNQPNVLYIHLLDYAKLGVKTGYDSEGGGDYFAGQGTELVTYVNLPAICQNLVYTFTQNEVAALNSYDNDGRFALGFDPDCHFYNNGVTLAVTTAQSVPEPMTLGVLGTGGVLMALRRRNRKVRRATA